jgi:hypothetical protein
MDKKENSALLALYATISSVREIKGKQDDY